MNSTIAMMLGVSIFLAFCAIWAVIWGVRSTQFDDYETFLGGTTYDSEEALNDAYRMEQRKKESGYRPPD